MLPRAMRFGMLHLFENPIDTSEQRTVHGWPLDRDAAICGESGCVDDDVDLG